ncbi:ankyrin repeat domain-containing protein 60 [Myotis lucifugus]|uniref:ankyrin repeat domain-containing protein 60 n=1 Tax=Myotis lucifugus TaxID=59463 RepID=UPI0003C4D703|nr:ankyrin repeat domain-containing protein 60 [Myotis lucifugus]
MPDPETNFPHLDPKFKANSAHRSSELAQQESTSIRSSLSRHIHDKRIKAPASAISPPVEINAKTPEEREDLKRILMDDTTLRFHDVVPGGIISLHVWRYDGWTDLVQAAVEGDTSKLSCLGVSEDSPYRTPTLQYLGEKQRKKWIAQRAFVALYIASHRGHVEAVQYLLEQGASCLSRSPMGRTPLHVAAFMGHSDCIGLLLQHGASISAKDAKGMTPRDIAHQLNRRQDEQQMFLSTQLPKPGVKGPKT